jgi:4-phytase/acid phosphatase
VHLIVLVFAALFAGLSTGPVPANAASETLEAVVLLSRHGVRAPTDPNVCQPGDSPISCLNNWSSRPWPQFPVPEQGDGFLTPQGARLAQIMGQFYGAYFRAHGLLPAKSCPAKTQVSVWADSYQRTIKTASKLVDGMFPQCSYRVGHLPLNTSDPLFTGICDTPRAEAARLGMVGGSWRAATTALRPSLKALQDVLGCCSAKVCQFFDLEPGCTLLDLPTKEGSSGPIGAASMLAENFIMEYGSGLPAKDVAWGDARTPEDLSFLNMAHALDYWVSNANPYTAGRVGSNLAARVLHDLQAAVAGTGPKLSVIVGHDNNLLNIGGLLDVNWFLPSYQQNQTPPGGAMAFEVSRNAGTGGLSVRVIYYAQTLRQLRSETPLSLDAPPGRALLALRGCPARQDAACSWDTFQQVLSDALVPACVASGDK